mmetsp:Transcript_31625/g.73628  ORF Transcript_31625/g.73628 Transcript_31625/m.73628 type:complete len:201 (-) Transcript_31625:1720-2322(-)
MAHPQPPHLTGLGQLEATVGRTLERTAQVAIPVGLHDHCVWFPLTHDRCSMPVAPGNGWFPRLLLHHRCSPGSSHAFMCTNPEFTAHTAHMAHTAHTAHRLLQSWPPRPGLHNFPSQSPRAMPWRLISVLLRGTWSWCRWPRFVARLCAHCAEAGVGRRKPSPRRPSLRWRSPSMSQRSPRRRWRGTPSPSWTCTSRGSP